MMDKVTGNGSCTGRGALSCSTLMGPGVRSICSSAYWMGREGFVSLYSCQATSLREYVTISYALDKQLINTVDDRLVYKPDESMHPRSKSLRSWETN